MATAMTSDPLAQVYTYDNLYRLTAADYTSGENYQYSYDPVGNRLEQVINGDTTEYLYDAANRLAQLNGQAVYSFDNNGNLLNSDTLTNTFDAANRLVETQRDGTLLEPIYNGVNDRVGQVTAGVTTTFALDIASGLPEVIYTSEGNVYLHLPGVIMAESSIGDVRYLLSDGLGSVRQAVDENGEVVAYNEFDPYGNPNPQSLTPDPYGFTGEWWEDDIGLLHLRARWYASETGTFLSVDPVESEPPYQYVRGNPINSVDPKGSIPTPANGCLPCRPGKASNGYSEFRSNSLNFIRPIVVFEGKELVFDFRTLEVAEFDLKVEPLPILQDDIQFDIGILSWDLVWGMNFISGFSEVGVIEDYAQAIRVVEVGASGGYFFLQAQAMAHGWGNSDGLRGRGLTYGLEASLLDLILGFIEAGPLPPDAGPEFATYNVRTEEGQVIKDFGDICNKKEAQSFLNDLQTRPGYGLSPLRSSAVSDFKRYVQRSTGFEIP